MTATLAVVILAGGDGARFGGNKPGQLLHGRPLIVHALRLAQQWSDHVAIAARRTTTLPDDPALAGIPVLTDAEADGGPLSGIASGLAHAQAIKANHVLIIPCDMPMLPHDLPAMLLSALKDASVALPEVAGRAVPVCSLWRTGTIHALPAFRATGGDSPFGFAKAVGIALLPVDATAAWSNINDPAALATAQQLHIPLQTRQEG